MAIRFIDSFDHYASADIVSKWTQIPEAGGMSIDLVNQRTGRGCAAVGGLGVRKTIDNLQTWIAGAAFKATAQANQVFTLIDIGDVQANVSLRADGTFAIDRHGVFLGASAPADAINFNRYYYLEWKTVISHTGSSVLRLNGQVIINLPVADTQFTLNATADVFALGGPGGGLSNFFDDLYVLDSVASPDPANKNNDFLGDVTIGIIKPNNRIVGDFQQWTPLVGVDHTAMINEIPPDGDTSYNFDSNVGDLDTYFFDLIPANSNVLGLQSNITARKDNEGNRAVELITRQAGNNFFGADKFPGLTYIDYLNQFDTNPNTLLKWTAAQVNAGQWGVKLSA